MELRNYTANQGGASAGVGYPMMIGPGYAGGFGTGGALEALVLASILGGAGLGNNRESLVSLSSLLVEKGLNDVRRDTKDSESELKDTIGRGNEHLLQSLCGLRGDVSQSKFEAVVRTLESNGLLKDTVRNATDHLERKIDCDNRNLERKTDGIQISMDKMFAETNRNIDDKFNELEKSELRGRIRNLERERNTLEQRDQTNDIARIIARNNEELIRDLRCALPDSIANALTCLLNNAGIPLKTAAVK